MGSRGDLMARSVATTPPGTRDAEELAADLAKLELKSEKKAEAARMSEPASPADFFQLHRLRTSALAHKTKTMSHYGGDNPELYDELRGLSLSEDRKDEKPKKAAAPKPRLGKEESKDSGNEDDDDVTSTSSTPVKLLPLEETEKPDTEEGEEEPGDPEEGELIGRTPGPVQPVRQGRMPTNYPYQAAPKRVPKPMIPPGAVIPNPADFWQQQKKVGAPPVAYEMYGVRTPTDGLYDYYKGQEVEQMGYGPGMGVEAALGMTQSYSPCSARADEASKSPSCAVVGSKTKTNGRGGVLPKSPFADGLVSTDELSRLLDAPTELPDDLSDFILKYSRRYSTEAPLGLEERRSESRKSSSSDSSASSSPKHRGLDEPGLCDSPVSAGSAPQPSPAQPKGAASPDLPTPNRVHILPKTLTPPTSARKGRARDRLRSLFGEKDNEIACLWAVKCIQSCPGALYFRDPDGDSLLHIVVWHKDLPKIYALVELMLKTKYNNCQKPFDLPNRLHETPLFLAVEKREEEVVSYLLECGANPNFQTRKAEADAPLHYAAARGMAEIVDVLTASPATDKNLRNGAGLTPLLCAVKNHGVIEEESQCLVNNKPTIRALLKAGADPKVPDAQTGKTVVHYAVERMDPELVEIYKDNLAPEVMAAVVNIPSFSGETPLVLLHRIGAGRGGPGRLEAEEELRQKMMMTLLGCGARQPMENDHPPLSHSPDSPYDSFDN